MGIDQVGQFSLKVSSTSGSWKSVATAASPSASAASAKSPAATGAGGDGVSVGKLAQALKGPAASAFQYLDPKARGMLEGLVNSGAVSADDAVRGLNHLAKTAGLDRDAAKIPGHAPSLPDGKSAALASVSAVDQAYAKGELSDADYKEQVRAAGSAVAGEQQSAAGASSSPWGGGIQFGISKAPDDAEAAADRAAAGTLSALGFNASVYRDSFNRYAADADKPGGAKAAPQPATDTATDAVAGAGSEQATVAVEFATQTVIQTATQTKAASSAPAKSAPDPSNAQAALSMLQSALDKNGKAPAGSGVFAAGSGSGANGADSVSDALMQALKAGTGQAKTDAVKAS